MTNYKGSLYDRKENEIKNSKILLLIKNKRNLALLSKFLDKDYTTYKKYNKETKYDLILIDSYNYKTKLKTLEKIKGSQRPLFLPVVLMHKKQEPVDFSSKMINIADEHILTPVKKDVLKTRIKRMLSTRELTKENYQINNKYKKIFNNLEDMVFLHRINLEERIFYPFLEFNNKAIKKTGYNKKELKKMKPPDLVQHDKDLHFFNYYINKLKRENMVILKAKLIKKDSKTMDVEINSKIIELDEDKYVLSVLREL